MSDKEQVVARLTGKIICPKCKKEIDYLKNYQGGESYSHFNVKKGKIYYDYQNFIDGDKVNDYECPECSEVLFTDEDKAIKFLKG